MQTELFNEITENLMIPIWQGLDADFKRKYRNIWEQFENQIKSAAYTVDLSKFLSKITQRLAVHLSEHNAAKVAAFIESADSRATLKAIRENTALLVLKVRVANEERREQYKQKINLAETLGVEQPLFTGDIETK